VKRLKVRLAKTAKDQIAEQVLHIALDSIDNALAWEARVIKAIERIGEVPGHSIDEDASERLGYEVRKVVFEGTYLIHYQVDDDAGIATVINFRHGARRPRRGQP
jgi:plasmid stabilization system protein ParE